MNQTKQDRIRKSCAHPPLEAANWQQLSDLFVSRIYIVCGFEEEDFLETLRILSCFV